MFGLWDEWNLFAAVAMLLTLVPFLIMFYASIRGYEGTVLCMNCQQCVAVCPVRAAAPGEYMGPLGIEVFARSGNKPKAEEGNLFSCTSCMSCVEACPRGLNVKHDMDKFRHALAKKGMGQMDAHKHIIKMASNYGNVFDKEPTLLPDIRTQKDTITKFLKGFAKITKYEDFEIGEGRSDG
ncbi:MAG: 4Fe-4S dicluster domain-containing protein [Thermoplasmata archaeon]